MATLAELKLQLKALKEQIDQLQLIYDQFGNIEETPVGRVYAIKFRPPGTTDYAVELFWKNTTDTWRSTYFYGTRATGEIITMLAVSELQWVRKVGSADFID